MQIEQQWQLLKLISVSPDKISTIALHKKLIKVTGREYSLRTVQRELNKLAQLFEIELDKTSKPYKWFWNNKQGLALANKAPVSLPSIDIGLSSLSDKVQFEAYFYQDLKSTFSHQPLSKDQKITHYDEDWFKLTATVTVNQQFIQWLLGCGDRVELVAPTSLREWLKQMLLNCQDYYAD